MDQVEKYFKNADSIIAQFDEHVDSLLDPYDKVPYVGVVAVAAVASYEMAIKYIFTSFASKKNRVFGEFTRYTFSRINGKIKRKDHLHDYIKKFGDKYLRRFKKKMDVAEAVYLRENRTSIKEAYNNIIEWRHQFVHECQLPSTATYEETKEAYKAGKELIKVLYETMQR